MNAFLGILGCLFLFFVLTVSYFIISDDARNTKTVVTRSIFRVFLGYAGTAIVLMILTIIVVVFLSLFF